MIRLATLQVLITSILLSNNNHPIILVHGFLGWGKEEVGDKSYWGGENDIEKYLNDRGFQVTLYLSDQYLQPMTALLKHFIRLKEAK